MFYSGRSIFQDRYLVFSLVALFGLWSVTWRLLPSLAPDYSSPRYLLTPCVVGLVEQLGKIPSEKKLVRNFPENGPKLLLENSANVHDLLVLLHEPQVHAIDFTAMTVERCHFN